MNSKIKVLFHRVKTNPVKLSTICNLVKEAFTSNQRILIAVPSPDAAVYIDQLLWRMPEESFIPHLVATHPTPDRVVIAVNPTQNLNQAQVLLNLSPTVSPLSQQFLVIRELQDETDPTKMQMSSQRQSEYRQLGYPCELIDNA